MDDLKQLLQALPPEELAYAAVLMLENRESCVRMGRPVLADLFNSWLIEADLERCRRDSPRTQLEERRELLRLYGGADSFRPGASGWVAK